jgi:hypothetical protein
MSRRNQVNQRYSYPTKREPDDVQFLSGILKANYRNTYRFIIPEYQSKIRRLLI